MKRQKTVLTTLECEVCGTQMPISRKASKQKKPGHVKHMYCPKCKKTQAFIERVEADSIYDFWDEFHTS